MLSLSVFRNKTNSIEVIFYPMGVKIFIIYLQYFIEISKAPLEFSVLFINHGVLFLELDLLFHCKNSTMKKR